MGVKSKNIQLRKRTRI